MTTLRRISPYLLSLVVLAARTQVEAAGTVTGISATPSPAAAGAQVAIKVEGTGACRVYVDFGDKQKAALLSLLPGTVKHVYATPRKYVIKTFTYTSGSDTDVLSRCGGFADMELVVNAAGRTRVFAPDKVKVSSGAASGVGAVGNPAPGVGGAESPAAVRPRTGTPTPTPTPPAKSRT